MNERIKELAEQSGLKVELWMTNPPKPLQILGSVEEFEKFAELIVKDCAYIADRNWSLGPPTGSIMKQYFGVDENDTE